MRLGGGAYLSRVDGLALPGRYPQLADRRLLNLLSYQPTVSANVAEAKLGEARAGVKRLWVESERGAGTIVGGERSEDELWDVSREEASNW